MFDPYEYIPSYGETGIESNFKDNTLDLIILFEEEGTNKEASLRIIFENANFDKSESFPGVKGMDIEYDYGDSVSSLNEFSNSNYVKAWEEHFEGLFKLSHYKTFL